MVLTDKSTQDVVNDGEGEARFPNQGFKSRKI